jgi:hypothetical protein
LTRSASAAVAIAFLALPLGAGAGDAEQEAPEPSRKASFAVVPGPFYNPNQGLGVTVIPMLLFHPTQDESPPSIVALMGLYAVLPPLDDASSRYSWALGLVSRLYLDDDRWRLITAMAYFDLFREFHGIGGDRSSAALFDYRQYGAIVFLQAMHEILWKKFYAGLAVGYTAFRTSTQDPANQEILASLGTGQDWSGQPNLGVAAQYDTKDDQYYPTSGVDFNLRLNGSVKSSQEYLVLVPSVNQYFPLADKGRVVLAYRIFGQFGFGDLPLASYANYGSRGTTLGYATGDYVDKMMLGGEVEARWLVWRRIGLEAGFGLGKVFPSFDEFGPQPWLPGGWGSITYKVLEAQNIRARVTGAVSKTGGALYFAIGQNF